MVRPGPWVTVQQVMTHLDAIFPTSEYVTFTGPKTMTPPQDAVAARVLPAADGPERPDAGLLQPEGDGGKLLRSQVATVTQFFPTIAPNITADLYGAIAKESAPAWAVVQAAFAGRRLGWPTGSGRRARSSDHGAAAPDRPKKASGRRSRASLTSRRSAQRRNLGSYVKHTTRGDNGTSMVLTAPVAIVGTTPIPITFPMGQFDGVGLAILVTTGNVAGAWTIQAADDFQPSGLTGLQNVPANAGNFGLVSTLLRARAGRCRGIADEAGGSDRAVHVEHGIADVHADLGRRQRRRLHLPQGQQPGRCRWPLTGKCWRPATSSWTA